MAERILTRRQLDRALLARQSLLERVEISVPAALEQVGGLQTQYAPSGYVGLWSRTADFAREDLTRALEARTVVQATLMRVTIHLVPAGDYWLYAMGVRRARREWWLRLQRGTVAVDEIERRASELRAALLEGPRSVAQLGELASGFLGNLALWVDLIRAPPSGTWERRRADHLALAETWLGPCDVTEEQGLEHLVRAYLRGFGPAPYRDISSWAGVPVTRLREAGARLELRRFRDEEGRELVDLLEAPLPDPDTPAPVRFLPHWDASLLVHARRTGILPEIHRPTIFTSRNPFSVGTFLVDGAVAGTWRMKGPRIDVEPFERLTRQLRREVRSEAARLEAFHRA